MNIKSTLFMMPILCAVLGSGCTSYGIRFESADLDSPEDWWFLGEEFPAPETPPIFPATALNLFGASAPVTLPIYTMSADYGHEIGNYMMTCLLVPASPCISAISLIELPFSILVDTVFFPFDMMRCLNKDKVGPWRSRRNENKDKERANLSKRLIAEILEGNTTNVLVNHEAIIWSCVPDVYDFKKNAPHADVDKLDRFLQQVANYFRNHPKRDELDQNSTFEKRYDAMRKTYEGKTNSVPLLKHYDRFVKENEISLTKENDAWLRTEKLIHDILEPYWNQRKESSTTDSAVPTSK